MTLATMSTPMSVGLGEIFTLDEASQDVGLVFLGTLC